MIYHDHNYFVRAGLNPPCLNTQRLAAPLGSSCPFSSNFMRRKGTRYYFRTWNNEEEVSDNQLWWKRHDEEGEQSPSFIFNGVVIA